MFKNEFVLLITLPIIIDVIGRSNDITTYKSMTHGLGKGPTKFYSL